MYKDEAKTGTRKLGRKGVEALEAPAEARPLSFDYILFDDTSRLARDQADVLQLHKLMTHHGMKLFFVSQRLDSADPNFQLLLNIHSMIDAQEIERIRHKVFEAQKGRVLNGYIAGSWPYGYRAIEENANLPGAIGRAATIGTRLEVVEEQAEVVRRIFQLYADGYTL
jgi:site-specific DNA recombinase